MDTAQTIIVSYDAFNTFARHFGDITYLDVLQNEWMAIPLMTSIGEHVLRYATAERPLTGRADSERDGAAVLRVPHRNIV